MVVSEKICKLMWHKRYVIVPEHVTAPPGVECVIMYDATVEDRNHYLFWKEQEEIKSRQLEVPTEGEIFSNARLGGYWTEDDELILKQADDHIQYLEKELDRKGFPARKRQIRAQIVETQEKKQDVLNKEFQLKSQTAEYLAHQIAATRMLMRLVRNINDELFWKTEEEFVSCHNAFPAFIQFLLYEMLSENVWEISEIREIARAAEWRMIWTLQRKNLAGLFDRPVGDLNLNQKLLVYWSRVYDSALEGMNPPDEDILNDDDKFDDWLANRDLERNETKEEKRRPASAYRHQEQIMVLDGEYVEECTCGVGTQKRVPLGMKKPHEDECKYGTWREYTPTERDELAARIYGRNNIKMRQYLDKEQDKVLRKGMVKEQDLRDQTARKILGANTNITPIRRR